MKEKSKNIGKESWWSGKQQNDNTPNLKVVHGIRLWFLPGVSEVPLEIVPAPGEVRFGMDIQRTEEVIRDPFFNVSVSCFTFVLSYFYYMKNKKLNDTETQTKQPGLINFFNPKK